MVRPLGFPVVAAAHRAPNQRTASLPATLACPRGSQPAKFARATWVLLDWAELTETPETGDHTQEGG
jgi:hypothetical protein